VLRSVTYWVAKDDYKPGIDSTSSAKATAEAAAKYERPVADQQRELQRVAGMTADEAKELLIRQIEADARRDAANLVKRLESEARETATAAGHAS
ncbi:MAG: Rnase Y domain-containing protein, partial [Desulfomicrobium escambiense]|nr:Rnase Y domain-containing protein [Desulfomicrobium escambiense]